ncbi:Gfo/Idh/MocA family protein [Microcella sp.]|uniref:Gfo/Idh/MocA family protein n=1 Tax=Microcella sp. TaxID=1913979 RepID=UPI003F7157D7
MGKPLTVGIVGIGTISGQYLTTIDSLADVQLVAVSDLNAERAEAAAAERPGVVALSTEQLIARDDIDVVLNLTTPAEHVGVALAAIAAGRSVYGEKPLATNTADGRRILEAAAAGGVRVGCAPDTVLGTGIQTARKAIDDGMIGAPIAASATMVTPGHERWHPAPDFYYQPGGGPLFDMGPYYLSALITLLGPVAAVTGMASRMRSSRTIATGDRAGAVVPVDIDSHVTALLQHESGAISTLIVSFDAVGTRSANIEVHGETGTLAVPDPNFFTGDVDLLGLDESEWRTLAPSAGYVDGGRGIGLADLAATPHGMEARAGGDMAFHVLDVMESTLTAVAQRSTVEIGSTVTRPAAVPLTELARR